MPSHSQHTAYLCCHREILFRKEILCDGFPLQNEHSRLHVPGWVRGMFMHVGFFGGHVYLKTGNKE